MTTQITRFTDQKTILLKTFKRDGTAVGTPVNIAVEGDHAFIRTYDAAWKAKRMRNNPRVEIAPSTFRGAPTGDPVRGHVRLLEADEARHAAARLAAKHRLLHGFLVPLLHRMKKYKTLHYELRLD
ncbi:PPOX class F420-dependent oxidoreductase [Amycolatopsis pittospori]|uniref:PPOX class F420-dependent oxidoreductase n=1 Tax=Amycolatopsis pittospori TaxID=2749434 RepID=UPI0015EFF190|nr:PPOX class F420-dependent oxidoreductase [Amycolatopsis pittospori]